jgi:hypothetical protein
VNQHSYPHWDDLDERMLLRLPGYMHDEIVGRAREDGVSMAEWIRRTIAAELHWRSSDPGTKQRARSMTRRPP